MPSAGTQIYSARAHNHVPRENSDLRVFLVYVGEIEIFVVRVVKLSTITRMTMRISLYSPRMLGIGSGKNFYE